MQKIFPVGPNFFDRIVTKTTNYTTVSTDNGSLIDVDTSGGAVTITLLAAATAGAGYRVVVRKKTSDANAVTISGPSVGTLTLSGQNDTTLVFSTGSTYYSMNCESVANVFTQTQTVDQGSGADTSVLAGVTPALLMRSADATSLTLITRSWGAGAGSWISTAIGGTRASPSATVSGTISFQLSTFGYDGTTYSSNGNGQYRQVIDGTWSGTNRGVMHTWFGTANGSTSQAEWMRLADNCLLIGTTTKMTGVTGGLTVAGTADSTSATSGSTQIAGGVGIVKNLVTKQGLGVGVTSTVTSGSTVTLTSASTSEQIFTGSTAQNVTLSGANVFGSGIGQLFILKNRSSAVMTINRAGSDTIEGATSITIQPGVTEILVSNGSTEWERCGTFIPNKTYHYILTGLNMNSAATDVGTFSNLPSKYRVIRSQPYDASINLTTATYDLRTATGGGGTAIVNAQPLSALTASTKFVDSTLNVTADYQTSSTLTVRNVTAQGAAATCSILLEVLALA